MLGYRCFGVMRGMLFDYSPTRFVSRGVMSTVWLDDHFFHWKEPSETVLLHTE